MSEGFGCASMPARVPISSASRRGSICIPSRTVAWLYERASASISGTTPWLRLSALAGVQRWPLGKVTVTGESSIGLASDHSPGSASASR